MRAAVAFAALLLVVSGSACGKRNITEFPGKSIDNHGNTLTRYQVSDQGSGTTDSTSYRTQRATIGGAYARQSGVATPTYQVAPGLHGNPRATQ